MIDPRTVAVAIPCGDGKLMCETAGALISCGGLYAGVNLPAGASHVSLARNTISDWFLRSPFDWLVKIDSDISFTRRDFELLMEPCDEEATYFSVNPPDDSPLHGGPPPDARPVPSRINLAMCQPQESGKPPNFDTKLVGAADVLVTAEYAYKRDPFEPVKLGLGFTKVHRSVFQALIDLKDDEGRQRIWMTSKDGRRFYDFYPSGPILSQFVPTAEWKGEDHGFFTLCMLAGIIPRIETRTRLVHVGRKGYAYLGPNEGEGQ